MKQPSHKTVDYQPSKMMLIAMLPRRFEEMELDEDTDCRCMFRNCMLLVPVHDRLLRLKKRQEWLLRHDKLQK